MVDAVYFDDLEVGQTWISPARTVTETDVVNFANVTGDFDPLHVDHHFAADGAFHRPIAHGILGLSWVAGLASNYPKVQTALFKGIMQWEFSAPIFFGDTVHVQTTVMELQPGNSRKRGDVFWEKKLINHNGVVVQSGVFQTTVFKRATQRASDTTGPHFQKSIGLASADFDRE